MLARLVVLNGKQAGSSLLLQQDCENLMGREHDSDLVLEDPACSRRHINIYHAGQGWQVADLGSANGTFVNGERVSDQAPLSDGDKILIGSTWMRFVLEADEAGDLPAESPPTWILEDSINPSTSLTSIAGQTSNPLNQGRRLQCLSQVSSAISTHNQPKALASEVLELISNHLSAIGARVLREQPERIYAEFSTGPMPEVPDMMIRQAMSTTEAVLLPIELGTGKVRCIFAPLRYQDQVEGAIWVVESPGAAFGHEDLCLVASIAHLLAPPLKLLLDKQQMQRKQESLLESASVNVIGKSRAIQNVLQLIARVADLDQTVLLRGESGVGKEVVARLIHETGTRRAGPMVSVNCAALPDSLLESELFGHEKGAFTGANERRPGRFEVADGGTLFLDELGNMSLSTQAKLLRILDGHPFERIGGHAPIRVDVRVLAATNADLESMVQQNLFRKDLYHRLRVIEIRVPPLRERRDDIIDLAEYFLQRFQEQTGRRLSIADSALESLKAFDWPGNVRQLRNTIERAAILSSGTQISAADIEAITWGERVDREIIPIHDLTRAGIERALLQCGSVPKAARSLGMSRSALYRHMKKLGVEPPRNRPSENSADPR